MRRVMVTGARGLIGSRIAALEASEHGSHVIAVDDGSRPTVAGWPEGSADQLATPVEAIARMAPALARGLDCIYHCASPVGPVGILGAPVLLRMLAAQSAALELARQAECAIITLSSSEVHGREYVTGDYLVARGWSPRHEYQVGKLAGELLAARHQAETRLPTAVVRPWNVAGPDQDAAKGFVFPRFAEQAVRGQAITIYGDGRQRRAFCSADDAAALLVGQWGPEDFWSAVPMEMGNPDNVTSVGALAERFLAHPLAHPDATLELVDPMDLHGEWFREASSGSKLPVQEPDLRGWTPLDAMVTAALERAAAGLLPIDGADGGPAAV
jgi:nucleoside-diphosphate-sugar epimerase